MSIIPGQTVYLPFTLAETPDSLPTVAAYKRGVDGTFAPQSGMSPTVVNISGLVYYASAIIPTDAEPGDGYALLVSVTVGGDVSVYWLDCGVVGYDALTPEQAAWLEAIHGKTALIGTGMATVSAPVTSEGGIDYLIVGDSYTGGRALEWQAPVGTFGDLTGWTAKFVASRVACGDETTLGPIDGTINNAGLDSQSVTVQVSSVDTSVPAGTYRWAVYAEKDGEKLTLAHGQFAFRKSP